MFVEGIEKASDEVNNCLLLKRSNCLLLNYLDSCPSSNETFCIHFLESTADDKLRGISALFLAFLALKLVAGLFICTSFKRSETRYCICHWMLMNFVGFYFILPTRGTFMFYLPDTENISGGLQHCRRYFLTLYPYILVSLALFSYKLVFKTSFRLKWSKILAGLYSISSFPTLYCVYVYGLTETYKDGKAYSLLSSLYPEQRDQIVLIFSNHIIPVCLITSLLGRVAIELKKRKKLNLCNKEKKLSLRNEDRQYIRLSFCVCFFYVVVSTPLIIREAVRWFTSSNVIDDDMASAIETIPFSIMPVDFAFFYVFVLYKDKEYWYCEGPDDVNISDDGKTDKNQYIEKSISLFTKIPDFQT